ncbi:EamA-like transporter family protein [Pseudooceanicola antarcticus]|uniref:EamA-like transporter family protein n=1 Tax=Pseudooceanicola antarcticus TaxID=1247613 RepID=A0A285IU99_9RHOB|nr:EamA family transporter [Pseudooceanicola antarcticus]PJE32053.1 multidrug transporter [Pseudooceanicola antarcticus]SNY51403.1 EamA-like transporter family protein [Pseudooceanicola antarcticus]
MSDWITSIEGTQVGHEAALILALAAAFLHALFGSLQKGRLDPWTSRGIMDVFMVLLAVPVVLFLVPAPEGALQWALVAGAIPIHMAYKIGMAMAYSRGAYTVVYPVVRGTGPVFTVLGAWVIFGETFAPLQWLGVAILLSGIFGLALYNLRTITVARDTLVAALGLALATGSLVAAYTTYDAYAIRALPDPFTFLAWFFLVTNLDFPLILAWRWRGLAPEQRPTTVNWLRGGLLGAIVAYGSFGSVMLATRLDKVGEAAVLRETSTVFAALIGWLVLKETVGPRRILLMTLIAVGAVVVEVGGR